jgi:hypothetical protein
MLSLNHLDLTSLQSMPKIIHKYFHMSFEAKTFPCICPAANVVPR